MGDAGSMVASWNAARASRSASVGVVVEDHLLFDLGNSSRVLSRSFFQRGIADIVFKWVKKVRFYWCTLSILIRENWVWE